MKSTPFHLSNPFPSIGNSNGFSSSADFRQRFLFLDFPFFNQPRFFFGDFFQQYAGGFIVGVLRHQLAAHGQFQNQLAQFLDAIQALIGRALPRPAVGFLCLGRRPDINVDRLSESDHSSCLVSPTVERFCQNVFELVCAGWR